MLLQQSWYSVTAFYYLLAGTALELSYSSFRKFSISVQQPSEMGSYSCQFSSLNYPPVVRLFTLNVINTPRPQQTYTSQCYYHFTGTKFNSRFQFNVCKVPLNIGALCIILKMTSDSIHKSFEWKLQTVLGRDPTVVWILWITVCICNIYTK